MTLSRSDAFAEALGSTGTALLDDTDELLGLVDRLHGLPGTAALSEAGARPDFRSQLRSRLIDEASSGSLDGATVIPITSRWNQSWARRNRTRLVTGAAAGVVVLTAVSVGASSSLPGNPLYPLKRGGESVQYAVAGSDEARGELQLGFARTRLDEIGRLTAHDAAFGIAPVTGAQAAGGTTLLATSTNTWVVRLFGDMDSSATKGSALLKKSFRNHPRPEPLREVQEFARYQEARLNVLKGRLAGPALNKATHSLNWAKQAVKQYSAALARCSTTTCPASAAAGLSLPSGVVPSAAPSAGAGVRPSTSALAPAPPGAPGTLAGVPTAVPAPPAPPVEPQTTPAPPGTTPLPGPTGLPPTTTPAPPVTTPTGTPDPTPTQSPPTDDPVSPTPTPTPVTTTPPSTTAPPSAPPTTAPPTTAPPTTAPPTSEEPTPTPTPTPVVTPPATPPATTPVTPPPATPPPPTVLPVPPVTVPPVTTTPAPPVTEPPVPVPPVPTTAPPVIVAPTQPPVTVAPTPPPVTEAPTPPPPPVTVAPTQPPRTGRPPLICLPPGHVLAGICIRPPGPPGRG